MQTKTTPVTSTVRHYLATIYWLYDQHPATDYIPSQKIADAMFVTLSAVNRMVIQMRHDGLIEHQRYKGVRLTIAGEAEAGFFLRRYSIAKSFLVAVMGFGWHEVHQEALNMTLGELDERVIRRMYGLAKYPTHDPHGYPIATEPGMPTVLKGQPLTGVEEEQHYYITRIATFKSDRLAYMAALNLMPGVSFWVTKVMPFQGPVQIQIGQEYRIVGRELASLLRVVPNHAR